MQGGVIYIWRHPRYPALWASPIWRTEVYYVLQVAAVSPKGLPAAMGSESSTANFRFRALTFKLIPLECGSERRALVRD